MRKLLDSVEVDKRMDKRVSGYFIVALLMVPAFLPFVGLAGNPEDPEIKDKVFDVKFFGFLGGVPQFFVKHIDVLSAWFEEDTDKPDHLIVCLKTRNLVEQTEFFEALYKVNWIYNHDYYGVILKIHTDGIFIGYQVYKELGEDHYDIHMCDGTFDVKQNIITWVVSKEDIGDPGPGSLLTSTSAGALLRSWDADTGKPGADIFKDLTVRLIGPLDERYGEDYQIIY